MKFLLLFGKEQQLLFEEDNEMAKNSGRKDMSVIVMVVIIAVVLVLGVYAVYGVIGEKLSTNKIKKSLERVQSGEATVEELADVSGLTVDEVLAQYGITTEDGVNKKTNIREMAEKLTLEKYCEFVGVTYNEEDFAEYKKENEIADDVTAETKDNDVKAGYAAYVYNKTAAAQQAANEAVAEADAEAGEGADAVEATAEAVKAE